jgi:hypothetical protein
MKATATYQPLPRTAALRRELSRLRDEACADDLL